MQFVVRPICGWRSVGLVVFACALASCGGVQPSSAGQNDESNEGASGGLGGAEDQGSGGVAGWQNAGGEGIKGNEPDAGVPLNATADARSTDTTVPSIDDPKHPVGDYVPMFVAQGGGKRAAASCDDGQSWTLHDPGNGNGGDHSPGAPQGLAYGQGHFVAAFGWGAAGTLRETETGGGWRDVKTNGGGFGGIAWAGDRFLTVEGGRVLQSNDGSTWTTGGNFGLGTHVRRITGFQTPTGSLVVVTGYEGIGDTNSVKRVAVSSNQGGSWTVGPIGDCVRVHQFAGGVAYGNGIVISVGEHGVVCRSADAGKTWTMGGKAGGAVHSVIWDGERFYAAGGARAFISRDGETWQTLALTSGVAIHLVARAPNGTSYHPQSRDAGAYASQAPFFDPREDIIS